MFTTCQAETLVKKLYLKEAIAREAARKDIKDIADSHCLVSNREGLGTSL